LIIANSHANGLSVSTSGAGAVTFSGNVDSGDTYQYITYNTTYATALGGGAVNTNKSWNQIVNSFSNLGTNQTEIFLATPVTQLQNALLAFGSMNTDSAGFYIGARRLCGDATCYGSVSALQVTGGAYTAGSTTTMVQNAVWAWVMGLRQITARAIRSLLFRSQRVACIQQAHT